MESRLCLLTAPKVEKLVGKNFCFFSDASNRGRGVKEFLIQRLTPLKSAGKSFYREGLHTEIALTVTLKLVMQLFDQYHSDCFKYSECSVLGSVCSLFLEASSWNVAV